ncbi:MAG: putative Ig domain-containing protein, partial [Planctomycetota bacterium]
TGEISGTPTTGGTSNFTVRATDSNTPADTDDQALSIYIPDDLVVTTSSLPDGQIGVGYSQTLAATGGVTPYSWAVVSGSLPAGLSLNSGTGEISGTPTTSGTSNFTVEATDSNTPADTDQQALSIYIAPEGLTITTSSLPDGQIGVAYSETLAATGGITPYSWAVVSGSLPVGLSLNSSTGEISGTPTTGGTSNFTVEVTDSDSPPATDQQALSIYVPDDLVVTTSSLADGQIDVAYSETLAATGGVTPYSWSIVSGSLPAGLSLNSGTGEISGTPTTSGTSNFTVRATDSNTPADTDDQALSIYVPDDLVVTTASLADGQIGIAYSETLAATGGVTPYSWSIVSGSLPAGLSLNSGTGEISGTPTTGGTSNFTVRATDSNTPADTDDQALSIYVPDDLVVTTSSLPDGQVGVGYSETLAATGGVTPYSWAVVVGSLPAGLSLNSSTGEISGTPTSEETANFTVEVTDSNTPADTDTQALSITIQPAGGPQTYYVATDGNDGWPGTQAQPWATLQYAVDTIAAGDTIIVENGTYVGCRIRYSGTAGNVKTLKAENSGGVLVNSASAQCTTPSNIEVKADTPTNGVAYWQVEGIESTSSANFGFEVQYGDHVTVKDCETHTNGAAGFYVVYSDDCLLEGNSSYSASSGSGIVIGESGDNNTLRGNTSYSNPNNGILVINSTGDDQIASGYLIEKNTLYGNTNGINADGLETSEITNNLIYDNTSRGLYLNGFNALISSRNNKVTNNTVVVPSTGAYVVFIVRFGTLPDATGNRRLHDLHRPGGRDRLRVGLQRRDGVLRAR